ncbi:chemotaxis protein CheB [Chryseolinea lacunae]|uniref:histidine kinase n=1 Tax=Chryseolinea lacunae TaxID=2801331 RepID=A0ABS1KV99_9BACT|nr:chemotaxis protein CheB [Chryseolinea lacunae]MBL0743162.1 PAS domain-containing protein [Chryseolinea lacunae]
MAKNTSDSVAPAAKHRVVGIGASAGGLEAIHDLFDYLPSNTGFSFIVIQHLSPDHKSLMGELLSKHTDMQVHEATEDTAIEPDCIYVIPSKKLMTINAGRLHLVDKLRYNGPNNAIDVFFESLADDQGDNAVGIILSGTGTDGTKGIEAIKRKGGLVIAQDPLTAAFDGMPNSAVATGYPDLILPPEMIGEELMEYYKDSPTLQALHNMSRQDENMMREILEVLFKLTRNDFHHYKRPTLLRRLAKRMTELGLTTLAEYKVRLSGDEAEAKLLAREFLINVTKFFRDEEAFDCLRKEVIPAILANKATDGSVKVWVAACSSGEEAYSVAMLFREAMEKLEKPAMTLKIFATDIDVEALETASRGVYGEAIVKDIPSHLLSKYFTREGKSYRVTPELRKHVVFANHDLLKDAPFSHLDLISCRNMFIYVNAALQRKALKKFHFALDLDGYLMLGPSENIGPLKDVMKEVSRKWKVYRCFSKSAVMDGDTMLVPLDRKAFATSLTSTPLRNASMSVSDILKDTLMEDRKIAVILIDKDLTVKQAAGSYKNFLYFPEDNFNFNLLKLVGADLAVALGVGVRKTLAQNEKTVLKRVMVHENDSERFINIIIRPYLQQNEFQQSFIAIVLEEETAEPKAVRTVNITSVESADRMEELERELRDTRENLQAVIEELETANEEMQSSNEEMISTNEELQSTNEELQSLNEELHTVSAEHQAKIKELFEVNDDLNNYFNNSEIGQVLVDQKLIIRKFSPSVRRMVNFIEADIGRSIVDITTNLPGVDVIREIKKVISTGQNSETEVHTKDGFYFLMRLTPYIRRDKSIDGVVVNFVDISHTKKLSGIIQGIFESSTSGIAAKRAVRDNQNRIVDFEYIAVNEAAERMFGVAPRSLTGKRLLDVFKDESREFFNTYVNVIETGESAQLEFYNEANDKWYDTSIVKMMDGIVTTHTDITAKRKDADIIAQNFEDLEITSKKLSDSNNQLERSNFDLMQFASVASHDLKEPLRKIQAFGNLLQSKIKDKLSDSELNYFHKMINASNRMQILIDDVLTLSKLSNNGQAKESTDLKEVIEQICEDLEISIRDKNAVLKIGKLPVIDAVPGQMRQVFQNLISNALKFGDATSPVITIEEQPLDESTANAFGVDPQHYTHIVVSDNGIGFETEYREKIFGIFQRLHGRSYEGTGIGLAIARKIVENHGGFIYADSQLNKGAVFHMILLMAPQSILQV